MEVDVVCRSIVVMEPSQVGEARREVSRLAAALGWTEAEAGRAALVATEAATNLIKHTPRGGEILVRRIAGGGVTGLELLVLDRGAGMADMSAAMVDGVSSAGTSGTGLGALGRVSDHFEGWSAPGAGTALLARLWPRTPGPMDAPAVGAVCSPYPGEEACGDRWAHAEDGGRHLLLVVDGLGHGIGAAEAAESASAAFYRALPPSPMAGMETLHAALRGTRGAAAALAEVRPAEGTVRFCGIGNVAAHVVAPGRRASLVSHAGIVGHQVRKFQEFEAAFPPGAVLVMHTDGVSAQWDADRYPGLAARDPALLAAVLFRDFRRGRDDATVAALRPGARG
ncbi:SpoIIE family protein phosphatase [Longimicrobium terrae]|uniref:Anti-sigma regulatory factor (Ser/Thr protein kinase) n=1 Tax=Longimicrobium terrae TaxID=1639882 RepID=A0A841H572_9BACT|nr:anti-sigma regulatory factor (Ser/Thr protein kinase) [Longimicrobium terrae]MBB6073036.1 anti-sigma regulatory factor (Ser/Thr protein kinase) [Longimicrobium terrae]NNC33159.1 SpoIIE family protein phosphatase [Longimicrobium terrae]